MNNDNQRLLEYLLGKIFMMEGNALMYKNQQDHTSYGNCAYALSVLNEILADIEQGTESSEAGTERSNETQLENLSSATTAIPLPEQKESIPVRGTRKKEPLYSDAIGFANWIAKNGFTYSENCGNWEEWDIDADSHVFLTDTTESLYQMFLDGFPDYEQSPPHRQETVSDRSGLTVELLESLGFERMPHYTVNGLMKFKLGRERLLEIGFVGTPNEMLCIVKVDDKEVTDIVVIHNYDYDGRLSLSKLTNILFALTGKSLSTSISDERGKEDLGVPAS
jgi:hypothetical protein